MLAKLATLIDAQKPEAGGGARSWWRWPILIVLVLFGVAFVAWVTWRQRRELAKLRHEKFKAEQLAQQASIDAEIASNDTDRDRALGKIDKLNDRLLELELRIHGAIKRQELDDEAIDRITWADLPRGE